MYAAVDNLKSERLVNLLGHGVVNLGVRCHFEAPVAASHFRPRQESSPYALSSVTFRYGFLEAGLRSHADGCDPSRPVGFVEGWFVAEVHRQKGVGKQLLSAAEEWARGRGCREMASDTQIDNALSQQVHEALGFKVVDRCVHYRKAL